MKQIETISELNGYQLNIGGERYESVAPADVIMLARKLNELIDIVNEQSKEIEWLKGHKHEYLYRGPAVISTITTSEPLREEG